MAYTTFETFSSFLEWSFKTALVLPTSLIIWMFSCLLVQQRPLPVLLARPLFRLWLMNQGFP